MHSPDEFPYIFTATDRALMQQLRLEKLVDLSYTVISRMQFKYVHLDSLNVDHVAAPLPFRPV